MKCSCPEKINLRCMNDSEIDEEGIMWCENCGAEYKVVFQGRYLDEHGSYSQEKGVRKE